MDTISIFKVHIKVFKISSEIVKNESDMSI